MPALRERQEDIAMLADHFIQLHSKQYQSEAKKLSPECYRLLLEYHWPGNVRELSNRIERYVLLDDEEELTQSIFPNVLSEGNQSGLPHFEMPTSGFNWEQFERYCLSQALKINQGNKTKAAKYLNLPYKAFLYRLEKFQITPNIT